MSVEAAEIPRIVDPSETRFVAPRHPNAALLLDQEASSLAATDVDRDCNAKKVDVAPGTESLTKNSTSLDPSSISNVHVSASDLSPSSLRRSTRACSLKAQEKLKMPAGTVFDTSNLLKADINGSMKEQSTEDADRAGSGDKDCPPAKKARIDDPASLDQFDCKFGITLAKDKSEVVYMSDESEISSLNEEEVASLRDTYETLKRIAPSQEILMERNIMIKKLEASLSEEEAKLALMRKLRSQQQQQTAKAALSDSVRKMTANLSQNTNGHAYKPPVAPVSTNQRTPSNKNSSRSAASSSSTPSSLAPMTSALTNLTPQQQQMLRAVLNGNTLSPSVAAQAQAILAASNGQNAAALSAVQQQNRKNAASPAVQSPSQSAMTGAQRAAQAKLALRRSLEQQLLQIPTPRTPAQPMHFVPNGNQPDFCYLLGLDLVVQRVLKDKNVMKKPEVPPYRCEECKTDFTPVWKAIGTSENDLHLYCEHCVKTAQKKKLKTDHTVLLRRAFQKIAEQEKEFDKQIAAGKFDNLPSQPSTAAGSSGSSHFNATASSSSTSTPSLSAVNQRKMATAGVASSSSSHSQRSSTPNTSSKSAQKRSALAASAGTPNVMNNAAAMAAMLAQAGPQLAALNALRQQQQQQQQQSNQQSNQLQAQLAQMMANPLLLNSWNPMNRVGVPNFAMALLAQIVTQSQQGGSSGNAAASAAAAAAASNPLTSMLGGMNPALAAAMLNPQMLRQFQQAQSQMSNKSKK
uniref:P66_CC domain-containing protein n=1 Tax=Steinernema glaseri TaxID=37863 RepID=A0A1I7ZRN9_9BILA